MSKFGENAQDACEVGYDQTASHRRYDIPHQISAIGTLKVLTIVSTRRTKQRAAIP